MLAGLSPITRRLVALGILLFAILGLINLVVTPLFSLVGGSLESLHDSRFQLARLRAIETRPPIPEAAIVPPTLYLSASDRNAAGAALAALIGAAAARAQLALEPPTALPPEGSESRRLAVALAVTGPEEAVLLFVNELERGQPPIRFRIWRMAATDAQPRQLRLAGVAMAVWATPR